MQQLCTAQRVADDVGDRPRASDREFMSSDKAAIARMTRRIGAMCNQRGMTMKNPLDSIWGTIISGLVLTAILYLAVKNFLT
jgi:hypothetical protein